MIKSRGKFASDFFIYAMEGMETKRDCINLVTFLNERAETLKSKLNWR